MSNSYLMEDTKPILSDVENSLSSSYNPNYLRHSKKYCSKKICFISFLLLTVVLFILFLLLKHINRNIEKKETCIPMETSMWPNSRSWNIVRYAYGKEFITVIDNSTLKIEYPKSSWSAGDKGGAIMYMNPCDIFPLKTINFTYEAAFHENFEWVKGGKLNGLWIGEIGASGGNHLENGGSIRVSWRSRGKAAIYLYIPSEQHPDFYNLSGLVKNDIYGTSLWIDDFQLLPNMTWNNISIFVKLNNVNVFDGVLSVSINNVTRAFNKMNWRTYNDVFINGIVFSTFFGGNDKTWATPQTTWSYLRNFSIVSND